MRPRPAPRPAPRESPDAAPNRRTLGPACHMLRDELRSGSATQACPAGLLAPGHRRQTRGASYRRWRKKREGVWPLGLSLQGPLLALGCGLVRGAGGGNKRKGLLLPGGVRMPASQDGPAASCRWRPPGLSGSPWDRAVLAGSQAVPVSVPGSSHLVAQEGRSGG